MLGNVGPMEIVVVLIIALVVFGPKRLPELGNSLGKGIREFKGSISGEEHGAPASLMVEQSASVEDPAGDHSAAEERRI